MTRILGMLLTMTVALGTCGCRGTVAGKESASMHKIIIAKADWIVFSADAKRKLPALRLTSESGDTGCWVGDFLPRNAAEDVRASLEKLVGMDASDPNALYDNLGEAGIGGHIRGAVDISAWDLRGRAVGEPVARLLGPARRDLVALYVAGFPTMTAEEHAAAAAEAKARGAKAYKIYTYLQGTGPERDPADRESAAAWVAHDMETARLVRETVGADMTLMFYSGQSYDLEIATKVGSLLDDLGYALYHDPMPQRTDEDLAAYVQLRKRIKTPLCAPIAGADRTAWVQNRAMDVAEVDVYAGGLTPCLRMLRLCEEEGMPLDLHGGFVNDIYQFPLYGITDEEVLPWIGFHSRHARWIPVATEFRAAEGPDAKRPWIKRIQARPVDVEGYVHIKHEMPGMGVELDWEWILAHEMKSAAAVEDIPRTIVVDAAEDSAASPEERKMLSLLKPYLDPEFTPTEGPDTDKELIRELTACINSALPEKLSVQVGRKRKVLVLTTGTYGPLHTPGAAGLILLLRAAAGRYGTFELIERYSERGLDAAFLEGIDAIVLNSVGQSRNDAFYNEVLPAYVHSGGGLVATHGAALLMRSKPDAAYNRMLGGYAAAGKDVHPKAHGKVFTVEVSSPEDPLVAAYQGAGQDLTLTHNWLDRNVRRSYKVRMHPPQTLADELYVLYRAAGQKSEPQILTRIRKHGAVQVFPDDTDDFTWALSWCKPYGKGRVFYTQFGHNMAVFAVPCTARAVLDALLYASGELKADAPVEEVSADAPAQDPPLFAYFYKRFPEHRQKALDLGYAPIEFLKPTLDFAAEQPLVVNEKWLNWIASDKTLAGVIALHVKTVRNQAEREKTVELIRDLAKTAEAAGAAVALYPYTGCYIDTAESAFVLAEEVDRENVGLTLHLPQELKAGNGPRLAEITAKVKDRLRLVVICGADRPADGDDVTTWGWDRLIRPLGKGEYDVKGFVRMVRTNGYDGPFGLICWGIDAPGEELLAKSMQSWKNMNE